MQTLPESTPPLRRIAVLLLDRFSNLALSNAIEPFRAANEFIAQPGYAWSFLSLDGGPVTSSSGLSVLPHRALEKMGPVDRLYVVASYGHLTHDTPNLRRALARAARRANQVIGLDSGPWLMASAGLLSGRRATLHWDLLQAFSERFLDVEADHALWVEDGTRITCAGATATLDLSRHLISRDLGPAVAMDVTSLFTAPQPVDAGPTTGDTLVHRAMRVMRGTLEDPLPLPALARRLGTSPRTLSRRCQDSLGLTPGQLYRHLRLSAARRMVESSGLSVSEIAVRCGYEDPTALTRAFRARFGAAPRTFRSKTAVNPA
ncbi:GlxA family transcriptional regulator [Marivita hallyeonensis]|nr:GlxA family transcriptional regulator [Marivita hallyeonensis]